MKKEYHLLKKSREYSVTSIIGQEVQFFAHILVGKVMRKSHVEKLLAPIVSLTAQCSKGVQFNWAQYLCEEFLENFCEVQEETKALHYTWLHINCAYHMVISRG